MNWQKHLTIFRIKYAGAQRISSLWRWFVGIVVEARKRMLSKLPRGVSQKSISIISKIGELIPQFFLFKARKKTA